MVTGRYVYRAHLIGVTHYETQEWTEFQKWHPFEIGKSRCEAPFARIPTTWFRLKKIQPKNSARINLILPSLLAPREVITSRTAADAAVSWSGFHAPMGLGLLAAYGGMPDALLFILPQEVWQAHRDKMVKHCPLKDKEKEIICCFDEENATWHLQACSKWISPLLEKYRIHSSYCNNL